MRKYRLDVFAAVWVPYALLVYRFWFVTDDAFISFRYARNLSEGYGLVFNPGFERVEGYSNFLWVLVLAGFHALGVAPESVSHVVGGFSVIAILNGCL